MGMSVYGEGRKGLGFPTAGISSLALCCTSTTRGCSWDSPAVLCGALVTPPLCREGGKKQQNPAGTHHRSSSSHL